MRTLNQPPTQPPPQLQIFLQGGVEAAEKLLGKDDLFDPEDCGSLLSQIDGSVGLKLVVGNRRCFFCFRWWSSENRYPGSWPHGPCLCEHDSCLYGEFASAPWHDDLGEDPWFPFVTNALNAKELYIKDKALFKGRVRVKQWAISFKRKYGIWVWNPSFCQSFKICFISSLSKISCGYPRVCAKIPQIFRLRQWKSNPHSSHSQKMDWKTKGSWILFLGALKGQILANLLSCYCC